MKPAKNLLGIRSAVFGLSFFIGLNFVYQLHGQYAVPLNPSTSRVEHIWSRNKQFVADVHLDTKVTRIGKVEWQGNMGRTTWLWSMDGAFVPGWLSNDGEHFVAGYEGVNLLLANFQRDQVMLSFYRRGQLISQVRLNQLIADFSKLQSAGPNYRWANYVEMNACRYLALETVEGRKLLFDVKTGKPAEFRARKAHRTGEIKSYQDPLRCYEFEYPKDYLLKNTVTDKGAPIGQVLLKRERDQDWLIDGTVEDISNYPREFRAKTFEEFVFERASAMHAADGCDSSTYVVDVVKKRRFKNQNNLDVLEFYLAIVHEASSETGTTKTKETVGPVYAVSLASPGEPHRVLFLRITGGARHKAVRDDKALKAVVDTVWRMPTLP